MGGTSTVERAAPGGPISILLRVFVLMAAATYLTAAIRTPAIFWHQTLGKWILQRGELPREDYWTVLGQGAAWLDHSWLFNCLLYLVGNRFEAHGLVLLKLLLVGFFLTSLVVVFSRRSGNTFFGGLLGVLCTAGSVASLELAPTLLALALFALALELAYSYAEDPAERKTLFLLAMVLVLYVNVHVSAYVAIVVVAIVAVPVAKSELAQLAKLLIALLLPLAISPYTPSHIVPGFRSIVDTLQLLVDTQFDPGTIYHYSFGLLLTLLALMALVWHYRPKVVTGREVLLGAGAVIAGLCSLMFVPFALLILAFLISAAWRGATDGELQNIGVAVDKLQQFFVRLSPLGVLWVLLAIIIVNSRSLILRPADFHASLPVDAVSYIIEQKLADPVYHHPGLGPYLIYRYAENEDSSERRASFDRRSMHFRRDLARDLTEFVKRGATTKRLLRVVAPQTVLCHSRGSLCEEIRGDAKWELLHEVKAWEIYRRSESVVDTSTESL